MKSRKANANGEPRQIRATKPARRKKLGPPKHIEDLLREVGVPNGILQIFEHQEIAWRIADELFGKGQGPEGCLRLGLTPIWAKGRHLMLYEAHVREQLTRLRDGDDLRKPTKVEIMLVLAEWSLQAPMNSQYAGAYILLFLELGFKCPDGWRPELPRESYSGEYAEAIKNVQRDARRLERGDVSIIEAEFMEKVKTEKRSRLVKRKE